MTLNRYLPIALVLLSLGACKDEELPPKDDPKDTASDSDSDPSLRDDDGDGWSADEDCDDDNEHIHPDAAETCNEIDDDCDDEIDDHPTDAPTWHADADNDRYGSQASSWTGCEAPEGWVLDASDCDDEDPSVNPDADELCDHLDNDCDGSPDGADALDAVTWYADADRDSYGDPSTAVVACEAPTNHVADGSDCDDTRFDVNPGAVELCNNRLDDDCDMDPSDCDFPASLGLAEADAMFYGDDAYDSAGSSLASAGDVNGDGHDDLLVGAPRRAARQGATYLLLGSPTPESHPLDRSSAIYSGQASNDYAGGAVAGAGDLNGDGLMDILIGARRNSTTGLNAGAAYVILGSTSPLSLSLELADLQLNASASGDSLGESVAGLGDLNGDGLDDILIGAPDQDTAGTDAGAACLFLGSTKPTDSDLAWAAACYTGQLASDAAGSTVAGPGDVNGDGLQDLLLGAPANDLSGEDAGAACLVLGGPKPADRAFDSADAIYSGETAGDQASSALSGAGDLNGDGFAELVIASSLNDRALPDAGAVYVVFGSALPISLSLASADLVYTGEAEGDRAGIAVCFAGDVDQDGFDDLLIGAHLSDAAGTENGAVFLVLGQATPASASLAESHTRLLGEHEGDDAGAAVSPAGDVNGDTFDDLLIGANHHSEEWTGEGAAWLLLGRAE